MVTIPAPSTGDAPGEEGGQLPDVVIVAMRQLDQQAAAVLARMNISLSISSRVWIGVQRDAVSQYKYPHAPCLASYRTICDFFMILSLQRSFQPEFRIPLSLAPIIPRFVPFIK